MREIYETYNLDGRTPIGELYQSYDRLLKMGWARYCVCIFEDKRADGTVYKLPVYGYFSPGFGREKLKKSFWVIGGIHGEEAAPPIAIAESVDDLNQMSIDGMPIALWPLMSPKAYIHDDRYWNQHRGDAPPGLSVTDSEFMLPDLYNPLKMRAEKASSIYAEKIVGGVVNIMEYYQPEIVTDHHEDLHLGEMSAEEAGKPESFQSYGYVSGEKDLVAPLCQLITQRLKRANFPIIESGQVGQGSDLYDIENGFVRNWHDGSIDELCERKGAKAVFVIETTRRDYINPIPLSERVRAHKEIIGIYPQLWQAVNPR